MLGQEEGGAVRQVPAEHRPVVRAVLHELHQFPGVGVGLAAELDKVLGQLLPGGADAGKIPRPAGQGVAGAGKGQGRQGIAAGGAEGPAGGGTAAAGAGVGIDRAGGGLCRGAFRGGGLPAEEQVVRREAQGKAQLRHGVQIRHGLAALPLADGLPADAQLLPQGLLGEPCRLPGGGDAFIPFHQG